MNNCFEVQRSATIVLRLYASKHAYMRSLRSLRVKKKKEKTQIYLQGIEKITYG